MILTIRDGWHPSKAQLEAYEIRELELAKINVTLRGNPPQSTLHSRFTLDKLDRISKL